MPPMVTLAPAIGAELRSSITRPENGGGAWRASAGAMSMRLAQNANRQVRAADTPESLMHWLLPGETQFTRSISGTTSSS